MAAVVEVGRVESTIWITVAVLALLLTFAGGIVYGVETCEASYADTGYQGEFME